MSNTFVISWDMFGVEAIVNVSDIEKNTMWAALKGEDTSRDPNVSQIVSLIMLRARLNGQRNYEVYAIDTEDNISEKDLRTMFEEEPQGSADLIRERGRVLFDGRASTKDVVIR